MGKRTGYALMDAVVSEMDSTVSDELVPIDKDIVTAVSEDDKDPLFITMQVLTEGVSKNKRNYTSELVHEVAEAINSKRPNGYQGHLSDEERKTKAPDPLVMWLGASVKDIDGKATLYARGYVMPYATKFKAYLRKAKAVGKNVAMSIQGTAERAVYNASAKAYDLTGFKLDSVDFAREGSEGVPNNGTLILASEMVEEEQTNKGDKAVNKADVLQQTTISEMEEHNPSLVDEIKEKGVDSELVSEMDNIKELVGDKPVESIAEMQDKLAKSELKVAITEKVKASGARPVIENMVLSEMEDSDKSISEMVDEVLKSPDGVAIMEQFVSSAPKIVSNKSKPEAKATRKFTTKR